MCSRIHRRLGVPSVGPAPVGESVEPASHRIGEGVGDLGPGTRHGVVPHRPQRVGLIVDGGAELPVRIGRPIDTVPRRTEFVAVQPAGEPQLLDEGHVLEQAGERQCRRGDGRGEPGGIETGALPRQRGALVVEETDQARHLVGGEWRQRTIVLVEVGHPRRPVSHATNCTTAADRQSPLSARSTDTSRWSELASACGVALVVPRRARITPGGAHGTTPTNVSSMPDTERLDCELRVRFDVCDLRRQLLRASPGTPRRVRSREPPVVSVGPRWRPSDRDDGNRVRAPPRGLAAAAV